MSDLTRAGFRQQASSAAYNEIVDSLEGNRQFDMNVSGSVTASAFVGDGSGLTGVVASVSGSKIDGGRYA